MYSRRQVVLYCMGSVVATVIVLLIFRATLWPTVRKNLEDMRNSTETASQTWNVPTEMASKEGQLAAAERFRDIMDRKSALLGHEKQNELMQYVFDLDLIKSMFWMGIPVIKTPSDMWMMQQLISEIRPDYIIEAGTAFGGSALYYAHVLEGLGLPEAKVITIDIKDVTEKVSQNPLWNKRVEFILGSSTDADVVSRITQQVAGKKVIVVLDSLHHTRHVLNELEAYSPLVEPGSYIIVEDTSLDGIPLIKNYGGPNGGPAAAVKAFLTSDLGAGFVPDFSREIFLTTLHSGGWLKRVDEDVSSTTPNAAESD